MKKKIELVLNHIGVTAVRPQFTQYQDPTTFSLVEAFHAYVAGETQDPVKVEYPANWFQAFRDRFLPKWVKRHWPVLYEKKEFSIKTIYPFLKSKLPLDLMGDRVLVLVNEKPIGAFLPETDGMTSMEWRHSSESKLIRERINDYQKCPCCGRAWFEKRNN